MIQAQFDTRKTLIGLILSNISPETQRVDSTLLASSSCLVDSSLGDCNALSLSMLSSSIDSRRISGTEASSTKRQILSAGSSGLRGILSSDE